MIGGNKQKSITRQQTKEMPIKKTNFQATAQKLLNEEVETTISSLEFDSPVTVYTLTLGKDGQYKPNDKLIRLPSPKQPIGLRLILSSGAEPSFDGILYTNYPVNNKTYNRNSFNKISFIKGPESNIYCDLLIQRSGIYQYYISYTNKSGEQAKTNTGYFIVDPNIHINNEPLPLDGINLLSIVPKWLGPISNWEPHFAAASELGYNFIHFVPLQKRGASNSPYSIFDQMSLSDDLFSKSTSEKDKLSMLDNTIKRLRKEKGLLSLIDMVWNHTSFDSEWLWDHPEAGYNLENSPHLRPAYELDTAILELSTQLQSHYNLKGTIENENDLDDVMSVIRNSLIPNLKLYEYYAIDVKKAVNDLKKAGIEGEIDENSEPCISNEDIRNLNNYDLSLKISQNCLIEVPGIRFGKHLDLKKIIPILRVRLGYRSVYDNLEEASSVYHDLLNMINLPFYTLYDDDVSTMVQNISNHLRYQRLADNGPRYKEINEKYPLLQTYFTRLPKNERTAKHNKDALAIANNGWVWAADPKIDFASPLSRAYLRRDVIIWGDCAKLRYGEKKEDNPWLWEHMRQYTIAMAKIFDGFRIDNCHSTPIKLAEYLLDCAREVNPNLYIVAELFTGSEEADKHYVCQLGLNSLIREAMQASDPFELSRLVHRYGGVPVGSLDDSWRSKVGLFSINDTEKYECNLVPIQGNITHSLFMDCTHDNETPTQKRTTIDALPNALLVGMTYCAIGSVKGYDEIYPKLLELVKETRLYQPLEDAKSIGIGKAKKEVLELHYKLCKEGYNEVHVHHENQYVMVHRQHPKSHEGYLLIAHTSYNGSSETSYLSPVKLRGTSVDIISSYRLEVNEKQDHEYSELLHGLNTRLKELKFPELHKSKDSLGEYTEIILNEDFKRGSVLLLKTRLENLNSEITSKIGEGSEKVMLGLDLVALNIILYRSEAEEKDLIGNDAGCYSFPNFGKLAYCGLQGFISALKPVMLSNDLGHPICQNLREGQWALDYTINRIEKHLEFSPNLSKVYEWYLEQSKILKKIPSFLFPKYFSMFAFSSYQAALNEYHSTKSQFIIDGDWFVKGLSRVSLQLSGEVKSTSLNPTNPGPCMAAGLPHFATHHMRCWGRDTFIALKGLYLCTGEFDIARKHLLAFAGSVKHGLVPNLLDSVRFPRYNARDATWWFLQALQDYCNMSPEGNDILKVQVPMRFPDGDNFIPADDPLAFSTSKPLYEIIQDIFQRHASGIKFREWNAGPNLDDHMSDKGFDVEIALNTDNGFIYGGSEYNCGTWMDKMGESLKAGTMGKPATPRDGAPIELTGLLKSTLRWILNLLDINLYPYKEVKLKDGKTLSFKDWNNLILENFEMFYYIPLVDEKFDSKSLNESLINRRGIYKDVLGSSKAYTDYQLRPNFPIAINFAPELFDSKRAQRALKIANEVLVSPLGMKTLDPSDSNYRGDYDNSNDSNDPYIAKGFNYHQGPEWGWPLGMFLSAWLQFTEDKMNYDQLIKLSLFIHSKLSEYKEILKNKPYAGIPELTNSNGKYCPDSCETQAWSASTVLDVLYKLYDLFKVYGSNQLKSDKSKEGKLETKINNLKDSYSIDQNPKNLSTDENNNKFNLNKKNAQQRSSSILRDKGNNSKESTSSLIKSSSAVSPALTSKATKKVSASAAPIQTTIALGKNGRQIKAPSPVSSRVKSTSPVKIKESLNEIKVTSLKPTISSLSKKNVV